MCEEETWHSAIEHDRFDLGVALDLRNDIVQLRNGFRPEDVERWIVQGDTPIFGRDPRDTDLLFRRVIALGGGWSRIRFCPDPAALSAARTCPAMPMPATISAMERGCSFIADTSR